MSYQQLFKEIQNDLNYVESELYKYTRSSVQLLTQSSKWLVDAGGKRLRPAFVLLSGKLFKYDLERIGQLAAAIELIHMATLVHDDVIDNAATRRGVPTVSAEWGDSIAIKTGDYIFAQALKILARYGSPEIISFLASVSLEMCEGEIEQIYSIGRTDLNLRTYLRRIQRKTAYLISACCFIGAVASEAPPHLARHLQRYGYYLGMAFQISDDLLDFIGSEQVCGKPVGSDLRQGIITIPVVYALNDKNVGQRLLKLLEKESKDESDWDEVFSLIKETGAIKTAQDLCNRYLQKAKKELKYLPDQPSRLIFDGIADFIGNRDF